MKAVKECLLAQQMADTRMFLSILYSFSWFRDPVDFAKMLVRLNTIKDWDLLRQRHFRVALQSYCALQESQIKMNFTLTVAPPLVYPMTSLSATPTHSARRYGFGFFSEPPQPRIIYIIHASTECENAAT